MCAQCHSTNLKKNNDPESDSYSTTWSDIDVGCEACHGAGSGSECVGCHMPGRFYMGNDYRPDHSFRIPDPFLASATDAPDACLRCHQDQDSQWSQEAVTEWYGPGRRTHYGSVLASGRNGDPEAGMDLARLAGDTLYPVNVRATALALLANYPPEHSTRVMETSLLDEEALIRNTAVINVIPSAPERLVQMVTPLLYDPVKTVRIEVARRLAGELAQLIHPDHQGAFDKAFVELEDSLRYSGDFASARHNQANLYSRMGRNEDAIDKYKEALRIDNRFHPASANLAVLYSQMGQNQEAEQVLRSALEKQPDLHDLEYSLGLLLVEMQRYPEALVYLEKAATGMPERSRIHYNLGLLYQFAQGFRRAENALGVALSLEPRNLEYQYALADHYLKLGRFTEARPIAEMMLFTHPENPVGQQMLDFIQSQLGSDR